VPVERLVLAVALVALAVALVALAEVAEPNQ
jgi:hypothetical protein